MSTTIFEIDWDLFEVTRFNKQDDACGFYVVRKQTDPINLLFTADISSQETFAIYNDDDNRPSDTEIMTFICGELKEIKFYYDWGADTTCTKIERILLINKISLLVKLSFQKRLII